MLPKNFNEPMGAPAIFEKQIEIKLKLLHSASTEGVTDSGLILINSAPIVLLSLRTGMDRTGMEE
ncbi:MAG: hypothetical protein P8X89_11395 [Reinekea sp.]